MNYSKDNPRFVLLVGAIGEQFTDCAKVPSHIAALQMMGAVILYDRQERDAVFTLHAKYGQALCLETIPNDAPFTALEAWFNSLSDAEMQSEGLPITKGGAS